jgi:putative sigma-54 modulation protein
VRTIVKGKHFEVPDRDRLYAERKLQRLERLLGDRADATVELSVEHHRSAAESHIVDVIVVVDGRTIRGTAAAATHRAGVDDVIDKLERQVVDAREKPRARRPASPDPRDGETGGDDEPRLVTKVKRFAIEPMFEEDAIARMEALGHAFFVFVDAETERVAVLYRRRDGAYGVIEPVIGGPYTSGGTSPSAGGVSTPGDARRPSARR